jgi:hypothetical protein
MTPCAWTKEFSDSAFDIPLELQRRISDHVADTAMAYCDTAFGPDYDITFKNGVRAQFVGAGECGMGGPIRGTLTISDFRTIPNALRPFFIDPREGGRFMGYQELSLAGTPEVVIHIVDRAHNEERVLTLPFSAYLFQEITADECLLLDEYKSTTTVCRMVPSFE